MIINRDELLSLSKSFGYRPEVLEKVLLLISLLNAIFANDYLKTRLALKGGTALNLFFLDLPRLSIDIDFDYIGAADRETMLAEKPQIERRIGSICNKLGVDLKKSPTEHSGGKYNLIYQSALQGTGHLELDINYILRTPLLPPSLRNSISVVNYQATNIQTLDLHEITAGKLTALFSRAAARDLYDTAHLFCNYKQNFDLSKLRLAFIVYGAMNKTDWTKISINDLAFNHLELKNKLIPVLKLEQIQAINDIKSWAATLQESCKKALCFLFPLTKAEIEFINTINQQGEIKPCLVTNDPDMTFILENHPALNWKALQAKAP